MNDPYVCEICEKVWPVVSLARECECKHLGIRRSTEMTRLIPGHTRNSRHTNCCSFGYALVVDLNEENRRHAEDVLGSVPDVEIWRGLTSSVVDDKGRVHPPLAPYVSEKGIGRHRLKKCCCFRNEDFGVRFVPQS